MGTTLFQEKLKKVALNNHTYSEKRKLYLDQVKGQLNRNKEVSLERSRLGWVLAGMVVFYSSGRSDCFHFLFLDVSHQKSFGSQAAYKLK